MTDTNKKHLIGQRIKERRKAMKMTQKELGFAIGVTPVTICKYEQGKIDRLYVDRMHEIAKVLHTSPLYLIGLSDDVEYPADVLPIPEAQRLPILGDIACGEPILAEQNITGYAEVPALFRADFVLIARGDSMIGARIKDGDCVYIRQQPDVENGEIAAVLIGSEATLKRVYKKPNYIVLQPENPAYEPIIVTAQDEPVQILGKAVGFSSPL